MTPQELVAIATARHGSQWLRPLARETGFSVSHLCHIAKDGREVSEKLAITITNLLTLTDCRCMKKAGLPQIVKKLILLLLKEEENEHGRSAADPAFES